MFSAPWVVSRDMLAIIGGTGLSSLDGFEFVEERAVKTTYAQTEVRASVFVHEGRQFLFLPRHGNEHQIPPHKINYRANIAALVDLGVDKIVGINAVGGIHGNLGPGNFAIPDQLIDYSYGRDATFFESDLQQVTHIDFSYPYTERLRKFLLHAVNQVNKRSSIQHGVMDGGVYGCTQGPRLETAAEVRKLERDGCDMIGMTGMPEAALAREMEIEYASLALSVNWAAGITDGSISLDDMHRVLDEGMNFVAAVLQDLVRNAS